MAKKSERFILWFSEIGKDDVALVGGKVASLGEMHTKLKVNVPNGFAITTAAYTRFVSAGGIQNLLETTLSTRGLVWENQ